MLLLRNHFRQVQHYDTWRLVRLIKKEKIETYSYVATTENDGTGKTIKKAAAI